MKDQAIKLIAWWNEEHHGMKYNQELVYAIALFLVLVAVTVVILWVNLAG